MHTKDKLAQALTEAGRGRQLVILEDAAEYIQKLPAAEQLLEEWQGRGRSLAPGRRAQRAHHDGAHRRPFNRNVEHEFDSSRKDKHWGKRKL